MAVSPASGSNGRLITSSSNQTTGRLYRTDHGADALLGAYFVVEIAPDGTWEVDFRNIGQVRKGICPKHQALGVQFVPDYW